MSEILRYLVSVDAASGLPAKIQQVGEAGDLTEVDSATTLRGWSAGQYTSSSAPQQIIINVYAGGSQASSPPGMSRVDVRSEATKPDKPIALYGDVPPPIVVPLPKEE